MEGAGRADPFLQERLARYEQWLGDGRVSFSSKVIPVSESFPSKQWVLPTEQAMEILRKARSVALQDCECRTRYKRCDKPREVCLLLNEVADKCVAKGSARGVSLSEALEALKKANESGLVHLTLYMPNHQVFALCSCCPCCCHDLQIVRIFHRKDLLVRSEYVAVTDSDLCCHCGQCVERCVFGARTPRDGRMDYDAQACLGCGLCVTTCPVKATTMQRRDA